MDLLLICLAGFFILLGIVGSFLPIIPGPMTSWIGLFTLSFVSYVSISTNFLVISFSIALLIFLLDIFIPIIGAKKFGGGKGSTYGASLGLLVGILFLGPFGLLIGPFLGAFLGELIVNKNNKKGALKAAMGSLIGFLSGVFLKFIIGLAFGFYFISYLWKARFEFFLNAIQS
tara:strand:+ start:2100 stop:2618 length:519 start_codon:yes stop_codon:yes gene_type:complete